MALVYRLLNKETGRSYVGWTSYSLDERFKGHSLSVRKGSKTKIHESMRKHGFDVWDKIILEDDLSIEDAKNREKHWISELNTLEDGYNLTPGGDGCVLTGEQNPFYGRKHSQESIDKMRITLGEKLSGENNAQWGRKGDQSTFFGKKHTDESKEKMRHRFLGRKRSEEDCAKMREGWAKRRAKSSNQ